MAYIKNLDELELDSYSHADLRALASKIMHTIGVSDSYQLLHTLADLAGKYPTNLALLAVREDPDNPANIELIGITPPRSDIQHFQGIVIPLIGAIAMHQSTMLKACAQQAGVGPYGAMEMLSSYVAHKLKEQGD